MKKEESLDNILDITQAIEKELEVAKEMDWIIPETIGHNLRLEKLKNNLLLALSIIREEGQTEKKDNS